MHQLRPILALALLLPVGGFGCNKEGATAAKQRAGKPGGKKQTGETPSAAASGPAPEAFQIPVKPLDRSYVRIRNEDKKGFKMTEDLRLEVKWRTKAGTTITPEFGEAVTATGETATTIIDIKKPVFAALKTLKFKSQAGLKVHYSIKVVASRKGHPKKQTRILQLRLEDSLHWFFLQTVAKGKPLLLPGEQVKRSGKKICVGITQWEPKKKLRRTPDISTMSFLGAGTFADIDALRLSKITNLNRGLARFTLIDRRTGKTIGKKTFRMAKGLEAWTQKKL